MEIESIKYKALWNYFANGTTKGLMELERLRKMLAFVNDAGSIEDLKPPPNFRFHPLTGNRAGVFAMTSTKNWRMTFKFNEDGAIVDMDLEDYHGA
ncbi:type II toxin-antitoxin system RelE/ParE family toxin [Novosphingobium album (ex Liu et al. 2023)]|uniref:Type II toxin-antitoxin system RelE/ParE family toxin n=1 Tax=Novosphingobium album (ex Liu et al. 2023) TaxID=3031130 RepID=A0ABM7F1G2_9SPHN|nr:type II toxin-antitoxin system RelE/ParE family toxin [Novosphingobium album (ex Liu et al. 2023)]MDE8654443.1 type II toxin-antitoxin system RelE/ParE family toxin [Novosphingobium album (ex Liu et al. 2023)]